MRHRVERKKLNRDMDHRKSMLMNLAQELITHEQIETTDVKAKFMRPFVERLISKAKKVNNAEKIEVFNVVKSLKKVLRSDDVITKLTKDLSQRYSNRNGGYTKITKIKNRDGDKGLVSRIELVKEETKHE